MSPTEQVVLVDDAGSPIGTADKAAVHTADTPLHLAFSCHVYSPAGEVLVTRRALGKQTWPGVWTNSFCGHPAPGESPEAAIARRARHELGITLSDLKVVLPARQVQTDPCRHCSSRANTMQRPTHCSTGKLHERRDTPALPRVSPSM